MVRETHLASVLFLDGLQAKSGFHMLKGLKNKDHMRDPLAGYRAWELQSGR